LVRASRSRLAGDGRDGRVVATLATRGEKGAPVPPVDETDAPSTTDASKDSSRDGAARDDFGASEEKKNAEENAARDGDDDVFVSARGRLDEGLASLRAARVAARDAGSNPTRMLEADAALAAAVANLEAAAEAFDRLANDANDAGAKDAGPIFKTIFAGAAAARGNLGNALLARGRLQVRLSSMAASQERRASLAGVRAGAEGAAAFHAEIAEECLVLAGRAFRKALASRRSFQRIGSRFGFGFGTRLEKCRKEKRGRRARAHRLGRGAGAPRRRGVGVGVAAARRVSRVANARKTKTKTRSDADVAFAVSASEAAALAAAASEKYRAALELDADRIRIRIRTMTRAISYSPRRRARARSRTGATRCVSPRAPPRARWRRLRELRVPGSSPGGGRNSYPCSTPRGCPRRESAGPARRRATRRPCGGTRRDAGKTRGGGYARARRRLGDGDFVFLACEFVNLDVDALARAVTAFMSLLPRCCGAREKAHRSIVSSSIRPLRRTRGWWS
jgi:hypothetical protein